MPRLVRVPRPIFSWVGDASLIGIFLPLFLIWQLQDHLGKRRFKRVKWKLNKANLLKEILETAIRIEQMSFYQIH